VAPGGADVSASARIQVTRPPRRQWVRRCAEVGQVGLEAFVLARPQREGRHAREQKEPEAERARVQQPAAAIDASNLSSPPRSSDPMLGLASTIDGDHVAIGDNRSTPTGWRMP
jgi:hypothetical protein